MRGGWKGGGKKAWLVTAGAVSCIDYAAFGSLVSGFSRSMIALSRQCQLAHPSGESPLTSRIVRSAPAANKSLIVSAGE